jgi:hypothetical protein
MKKIYLMIALIREPCQWHKLIKPTIGINITDVSKEKADFPERSLYYVVDLNDDGKLEFLKTENEPWSFNQHCQYKVSTIILINK